MLRMDQQRGKVVLVEFWDFCRVNSLRTLPYLKAWHERYADAGLRVVGVHTGGFAPGARRGERPPRGRAAGDPVAGRDRHRPRGLGPLRQRGLAGALPVGPRSWRCTRCTTARAPTPRPSSRSRRCSGVAREPLAPVRPEDAPDALIAAQTEDQPGAVLGPVRGRRRVGGRRGRRRSLRVNGVAARRSSEPGCIPLRRARASTPRATLELEAGAGRDRPRHLLHAGLSAA